MVLTTEMMAGAERLAAMVLAMIWAMDGDPTRAVSIISVALTVFWVCQPIRRKPRVAAGCRQMRSEIAPLAPKGKPKR